MEWVQTTAKTVEAAREAALDQLGVAADDAEFEVIEEPRPGLFGRVRGEARVRARVRPTPVRPKQERRRRSRSGSSASTRDETASNGDDAVSTAADRPASDVAPETQGEQLGASTAGSDGPSPAAPEGRSRRSRRRPTKQPATPTSNQEQQMSDDQESTVTPDEVGAAAVTFMEGLATAFGATAEVDLAVDGLELDVAVSGSDLGLMVGPGGRTLNAVQDLARVAAQRRLGDHETRLRIDVGGYRSRREVALGEFARNVAEQVRSSGTARSLEPMTSADRKVVHDVLNDEAGVSSRSVGDDPDRRIVVEPA